MISMRLILLSLLAHIFISVNVAEEVCTGWANGRYYLYATQHETISDLAKSDPEWNKAASGILKFIRIVEKKRIDDGAALRCLKHDTDYQQSYDAARNKLQTWGFGDLDDCGVQVEWGTESRADRQEKKIAREVYRNLEVFDGSLVSEKTSQALQKYDGIESKNWTELHRIGPMHSVFVDRSWSYCCRCKTA